LDEWGIRACQ